MRKLTAVVVIVSGLIGCDERHPKASGSPPPVVKAGPEPNPAASPLKLGQRAIVYSPNPEIDRLYFGDDGWPIAVGTAITVIDDPGGSDPARIVRINIPAASVPEKSIAMTPAPGGDLATTTRRDKLRPAPPQP